MQVWQVVGVVVFIIFRTQQALENPFSMPCVVGRTLHLFGGRYHT